MIKLKGIYTIRDTPQAHFWDIVFEWEDQMAASLGIPLVFVGKEYDTIYKPGLSKKLLNRANAYQLRDQVLYNPDGYYLAFHIGPPGVYSFHSRKDVIPIIIDFWKGENIPRLESIFKLSHTVFVTSMEVLNYLRDVKVRVNVQHLALSLPDKNISLNNSTVRDIDIIQIGRSNAAFNEYMNQFLAEYPETHYVSAKKIDNELCVFSNRSGSMGVFKERVDFLSLLKRSKISLVSAPGLDDDKVRTGGFSPVTPRFLESAACGCKLIGIYPNNADFEYYLMKEVCESVSNYSEFKKATSEYLSNPLAPDYSRFLARHTTSRRANELIEKLK
jgi:hypothetical protein